MIKRDFFKWCELSHLLCLQVRVRHSSSKNIFKVNSKFISSCDFSQQTNMKIKPAKGHLRVLFLKGSFFFRVFQVFSGFLKYSPVISLPFSKGSNAFLSLQDSCFIPVRMNIHQQRADRRWAEEAKQTSASYGGCSAQRWGRVLYFQECPQPPTLLSRITVVVSENILRRLKINDGTPILKRKTDCKRTS